MSSNIAEDAKICDTDGGSCGDRNETIEKSPHASNSTKDTGYFNLEARKAFTQLKQAFIQALIFEYFNSERHIQIETNTLSYAINEIRSQLTTDGSI